MSIKITGMHEAGIIKKNVTSFQQTFAFSGRVKWLNVKKKQKLKYTVILWLHGDLKHDKSCSFTLINLDQFDMLTEKALKRHKG